MAIVDIEQDRPHVEVVTTSRLRAVLVDPGRLWNLIGIPVLVIGALIGLWLWIGPMELDLRESRHLTGDAIRARAVEHVQYSALAALLVVIISVPLGIMLTRPWAKPVTPIFLALANAGQAIPSIGLMTLLGIWIGTGATPAVIAVVAYCILPVLRNTMVGIRQVDEAIIEAGRGMGMTKSAVLLKIELPLAVPVILAGVRTALILAVGTITIGAVINAGTFGVIINGGVITRNETLLLAGAVLTAAVALTIDWLAGIAELVLRPKGL